MLNGNTNYYVSIKILKCLRVLWIFSEQNPENGKYNRINKQIARKEKDRKKRRGDGKQGEEKKGDGERKREKKIYLQTKRNLIHLCWRLQTIFVKNQTLEMTLSNRIYVTPTSSAAQPSNNGTRHKWDKRHINIQCNFGFWLE